MYALSELGELQLSRPAADAPVTIVAAWHERRAVVLEHLAAESPADPTATQAAKSAHRYAARLASAPVAA
ncbi:hypothetical protein [Amycolatopsis echigonensis]|uniref:Uncharacterized protein n=1 Tax=Amycolatopsis echigonensis TaxID=2576905 RepID=A0A2N3WEC0_9PSEU|nr:MULTISPECIES: hypothetical protein [Amycolatopsis]MBB2499644.1 hypothetical protein [Amycolatopsis echigonensis]PKV92197.1 hypothetical protein ATK30_2993 [Amycolatopsis niigatensis]